MLREIRTDLALELAKPKIDSSDEHLTVTTIKLNDTQAARYGKAAGRYVTLDTRAVTDGKVDVYRRVSKAVAKTLLTYMPNPKSVLVAALGNAGMTADALGSLTADGINVNTERLKTVKPGVMGATGIESYDVVRGVCDQIKPSLVIVVDSLAAAATNRVCNVFQFSDGGITPGSGVANHRKTLSASTLGVPVVSVGVPLVVYATTIIEDADGDCNSDYVRSLIVTPKDIDLLVRDCARIISDGINLAYS